MILLTCSCDITDLLLCLHLLNLAAAYAQVVVVIPRKKPQIKISWTSLRREQLCITARGEWCFEPVAPAMFLVGIWLMWALLQESSYAPQPRVSGAWIYDVCRIFGGVLASQDSLRVERLSLMHADDRHQRRLLLWPIAISLSDIVLLAVERGRGLRLGQEA